MTERVVLLGHGIGYSASPAMHNAAFAALGLPWSYELRDVPAAGLPAALADLRAGRLRGANLTQPHKGRVLDLLDELDPLARRVGAVNTIVATNGRLAGHDTDVAAIAEELALLAEELALFGLFRSAVVLGRGGGARAAAAALADAGTSVELVGRDRWVDLPALLSGADVLVNATPVGTASDESPVDTDLLRSDLAVLDLVYRPSPTRLVREARTAGATARGGAGVLLRQAASSFSLWSGLPAPVEAMREALRTELGDETDA
jgi:shikimate dehydrogenase